MFGPLQCSVDWTQAECAVVQHVLFNDQTRSEGTQGPSGINSVPRRVMSKVGLLGQSALWCLPCSGFTASCHVVNVAELTSRSSAGLRGCYSPAPVWEPWGLFCIQAGEVTGDKFCSCDFFFFFFNEGRRTETWRGTKTFQLQNKKLDRRTSIWKCLYSATGIIKQTAEHGKHSRQTLHQRYFTVPGSTLSFQDWTNQVKRQASP